ncbi:MAG: hypothetical protein QW666_02650 [Candidatus Woesearchaeota archaeon]
MVDVVKDIKVHIQRQLAKGYSLQDIQQSLLEVGFSKEAINEALKGIKRPIEKPAEKVSFFGWLKPKPAVAPKPEVKKPEEKPAPKTVTKPEIKKPEPKPEKRPVAKFWFGWRAEKPSAKETQVKKPEPKKEIKKTEIKPKEIKLRKEEEIKLKIPHKGVIFGILLVLFFVSVGLIIWLLPRACATEACFIRYANACKAARYTNNIEGTVILYEVNNCVLRKTIKQLAPDEPPKIVEKFLGKSMLCTYAKNDFNPLHVRTISGMVNTCQGPLKDAILDYVV